MKKLAIAALAPLAFAASPAMAVTTIDRDQPYVIEGSTNGGYYSELIPLVIPKYEYRFDFVFSEEVFLGADFGMLLFFETVTDGGRGGPILSATPRGLYTEYSATSWVPTRTDNLGIYFTAFQPTSYTLTITGIGPISAVVPEPTTWALMIFGFGAIGFAMRRRQKVAVSYA